MEKTFYARFDSHQEASEAMQQVKDRFPDVTEENQTDSTFNGSDTTVVSSQNFWAGMGGVFIPAYMTNPDTTESTLANRYRDHHKSSPANEPYELKFKASEENSPAITNLLEIGGGYNIQIK